MKIKVTPIFTTMTTGHGNIKSYLHRFKIIESPTCPCGTTEQTIDHLIFQCELLGNERDKLISGVSKTYVCMYVCMYVCTYVRMYVCM